MPDLRAAAHRLRERLACRCPGPLSAGRNGCSFRCAQPAETAAPSAALPDANLEPVGEPTPFEIAQGFIDHPLDELVAAIGEPLSSVYGPSCLIPGGQDGQLQYDGFWIYSVKDGEMETVKDVLEGEA